MGPAAQAPAAARGEGELRSRDQHPASRGRPARKGRPAQPRVPGRRRGPPWGKAPPGQPLPPLVAGQSPPAQPTASVRRQGFPVQALGIATSLRALITASGRFGRFFKTSFLIPLPGFYLRRAGARSEALPGFQDLPLRLGWRQMGLGARGVRGALTSSGGRLWGSGSAASAPGGLPSSAAAAGGRGAGQRLAQRSPLCDQPGGEGADPQRGPWGCAPSGTAALALR